MAEVNVMKETKPERTEITPRWRMNVPFFSGSMFGVNPFELMRRFTEDLDKAFGGGAFPGIEAAWRPPLEIKEEAGKLTVTVELPGLNPEDVKVHVTDNVMVIEGERKKETEEKGEGYFHSERTYGKFYRSFTLPDRAKGEDAKASFDKGILTLTIPMAEKIENKREIPIESGPPKDVVH